MHFVTLTSDWGKADYYAGAIKGNILSACSDVNIVTLSHSVKSYSIAEAAYILRNSYPHFPEGSIHIIAVHTDPEPDCKLLLARIDGHFFLTADNGILGLLGDAESSDVVSLKKNLEDINETFPALKYFSHAASSIINGTPFEDLGEIDKDYRKQIPLRATIENDTITGTVIHLDAYGNAITNITRELFERVGQGREFNIYVQSKHYRISKLNQYYSSSPGGDLLALFNSINLLEIAIRNGSARELMNLNTDSTIRVEFKT